MRSRHVEKFNHDEDAPGYDADVRDESNPIRAGYDQLLTWMAEAASPTGDCRVLDLGAGTGNLGLRLPDFGELVCVDVSEKMAAIGKQKLSGRAGVSWVLADLLAFFDQPLESFDRVLSSYSIHHLTPEEKIILFEKVWSVLVPGGSAVFGDLMFESDRGRQVQLDRYARSGRRDLVNEIEDEFFWNLEDALRAMKTLGFETAHRRFSDLSWGVLARKPA